MFFWRQKEDPSEEIYAWILSNKDLILSGEAEYEGVKVDTNTLFHQYSYVVSLGLLTIYSRTPHFLPTASNGFLKYARWKYGLITLICGWWGLPWGPPMSLHSLWTLMNGSRSRTANNLLRQIEWGWDTPSSMSSEEHRKGILSISEAALDEIRARLNASDFPPDIGVRISPVGLGNSDVIVAFDYPVSDGRDWIDEADGIPVLIDKDDETQLCGRTIEYNGKVFTAVL